MNDLIMTFDFVSLALGQSSDPTFKSRSNKIDKLLLWVRNFSYSRRQIYSFNFKFIAGYIFNIFHNIFKLLSFLFEFLTHFQYRILQHWKVLFFISEWLDLYPLSWGVKYDHTVYPIRCVHCYVALYFVVVLFLSGFTCSIYPYSSGLLHWHWGNHMIAPMRVKWPWRIWVKLGW